MNADCDLCGAPAKYDGKTVMGPWAYMCEKCFKENGIGLGVGKGQILADIGKKKKIEDGIPGLPEVF
jgi:hypothetical protein